MIDDAFQTTSLVEKLPPFCKDYKGSFKYKNIEFNLEDLIIRIRIEDKNHIKKPPLQYLLSKNILFIIK